MKSTGGTDSYKNAFSPQRLGRNPELESANKEIDFLNKQILDLRE